MILLGCVIITNDKIIIQKSKMFDEEWFKKEYGLSDDVDLIQYYLDNAINLNLDPSPFFSTENYLKKYKDVEKNGINPFVHYIKYGIHEGRFSDFQRSKQLSDRYLLSYNDYDSSFLSNYENIIKNYKKDNFHNQVNIGIFLKTNSKFFFPTGYIRLIIPFYHLFQEKNITPYVFSHEDFEDIQNNSIFLEKKLFDVIVVQRDCLNENISDLIIKICKKFDTKLIYELDDDLLNIDESHPDYEEFIIKKKVIEFLISNADFVSVSTNALKNKISYLNSNCVVIKNSLNNLWEPINYFPKSLDNTVKIGYMGSFTHENDINLVKNVVEEVKKYFSTKSIEVSFEIIGGTGKDISGFKSIEIPKGNNLYPNFVKWLKHIVDWDIGLAPLENNNINSSKSEIKYLEYSALGLVGIYSDIGAYSDVITDHNNGILIKDNDVELWKNAIIELIENNELYNKILKNSFEDINKKYSINSLIASWVDLFNKILSKDKIELFNKSNNYKLLSNPIFNEEYSLIKNSEVFDENYYLKKYNDIGQEYDPIYHYMTQGIYENCKPSEHINLTEYIKVHNIDIDVINPLVHYISSDKNDFNFKWFKNENIDKICNTLKKEVSIIIPIYNAFEDTKNCIESVLKHSKRNFELILINDCSPDKRIRELLEHYSNNPKVKVIHNEVNKGFTGTVNVGLKNSYNDVILLNSDTIVTPKWLEKLTIAAYSDEKIGTVTPFSNNAGAFSVPEIGENEIPKNLSLNEMANIVEKVSNHNYVHVPTGNGFCLYIKRETINSVGLFDEETFGKGYGEENDYCMRALEKNWHNIIDDSTYIFHNEGSSFSTEREELLNKHRLLVDIKHPTYTQKIRKTFNSPVFNYMRNDVKNGLLKISFKKYDKKRILYVIHSKSGGTFKHLQDLMEYVEREYDCYLLFSHIHLMKLYHFNNKKFQKISEWKLNTRWWAEKIYIDEYKNIYFNILINLNIDIVHLHHMMHNSFDLPKITKILNIPTVMTIHDFFLVCPCFTLLNENFEYCKGICNDNLMNCQIPSQGITQKKIIKSFIKEWRLNVNQMFKNIDYFVTMSVDTKNIFNNIFPNVFKDNIKIIEHGTDYININENLFEVPSEDKPIKLLCTGNILPHKGSKFIKELYELDKNANIEFHFLGQTDENLKDIGIHHGEYELKDLISHIRDIKPSFICIFSIWPETFCYTLSEAWAFKIPVLASKIGVIEERMVKNNGGIFIDKDDVLKSYKSILDIKNNPKRYIDLQKNIEKINFKPINEMSDEYVELYNDLLKVN